MFYQKYRKVGVVYVVVRNAINGKMRGKQELYMREQRWRQRWQRKYS